MGQGFGTIDGATLERRLASEGIDNEDRHAGLAVVNVLDEEDFEREHIPGSIHIPQGEEERFEALFDKDKEIVVYCASSECDASPRAAQALVRRGFERVLDYEEGIRGWRAAGRSVEGAAQAPRV